MKTYLIAFTLSHALFRKIEIKAYSLKAAKDKLRSKFKRGAVTDIIVESIK